MKEKQKTCITIFRSFPKLNATDLLGKISEFISIPHNVDIINIIGGGCLIYNVADDTLFSDNIQVTTTNLINNIHDNILIILPPNNSYHPNTLYKSFKSPTRIINGNYNFTLSTFDNFYIDHDNYGEWFINIEFIELEKDKT